ncbi:MULTISPECIES: hypothetical protein [Paenibacillus]|uniref:Uncharacterized protein n=1 Tax=Paenibacillus alvei TaxID=44250 RepID=A0A383RAW1_PAEAL|nr:MULTISPECIES: hypothetical protein [Paenibacillus]MCY9531736.1 hypothetical protein [Paenibacillus alvei]SYX83459.1 conserved protein of unknown function [Paenibacillus alvei]
MNNKQSHDDQVATKAEVQSTKLNKLPVPEQANNVEFSAEAFEQAGANRSAAKDNDTV